MKNKAMKTIRLFALTLASALIVGSAARAEGLASADALFDKGLYQEALKGYEAGLKDRDGDVRLKSLYRSAECRALLFRYGEAAQGIFEAKLPDDPVWKGRFLILRAELAREFLKQYGRTAPADVEEGQKDLTRRTPEQWRAEIRSSYRRLWDLRRNLVEAPLRGEGYFVDLRNADIGAAPTLWDFAALRWSGYLLNEEESRPAQTHPAALSLLGRDYSGTLSFEDGPAAQAAALYEETSRLGGKGRDAARELWRLRRLKLSYERSDLVSPAPDHKAFVAAAVERLKGWMSGFATPLGRAEAGEAAAGLLSQDGRYAEAVELCREVEKNWPSLLAAKRCAKMRSQIELPTLGVTAKFVPPGGRDAFRVDTRNLDKVFFRLYRVDPEELRTLRRQYRMDGWAALRQPADKEVLATYLDRQPDYAWATEIKPAQPYANASTPVQSPELKTGIYLSVVSGDERFKPGSSLLNTVYVNVTDLFLIASSGAQGPERDFIFDPAGPLSRNAPILHLYTIDGLTGKPVSARLDVFRRDDYQPYQRVAATTDDSGRTQLAGDLTLVYGQSSSFMFDPLAEAKDSYAYPANPLGVGHSVPAPVELFLETDRPIYRPSQDVRVKVTVLRRIPRGYKVYDGTSSVDLRANDANGQELFKTTLKLDALGSAQAKFAIPAGRLLGNYAVYATLTDFGRGFSAYAGFSVEEYKRPEFEVEVKEATGPWKFGAPVTVEGAAKYYFGGAVPDAPVSYRVYRESYVPWFCWWWRGFNFGYGRAEILSGQTKTDAEGKFSFGFTPQPQDPAQKDPWPASFVVEAESRDAGGRTITASHSFRAGAKAYLFDIAPDSGFLSAGKPAEIPIRLMNLNEKAVAGQGSFALHRLLGQPKASDAVPQQTYWYSSFNFLESPSLEALFKNVPDGPLVASGELAFGEETPAKARLGGLEQGSYRLTVRAKDPWGGVTEQSIVLAVAGGGAGKQALNLPAVTLPEHASVLVGETARVLLGSALLDGAIYVEVWGGEHLLERRVLDGAGIRVLSVPVGEDHKGGFTVRWFGARGFKLRAGEAHVDVPWSDRGLTVKLKHDPVMKPGEKVTWSLSVRDAAGRAVDGEATVRVFDRSLEYYAKALAPWVGGLYPERRYEGGAEGSLYTPYVGQIPVEEGWIKKMLTLYYEAIAEPQPPMLRLNKSRVYNRYRLHRFALAKGMAFDGALQSEDSLAAASPAPVAAAAGSMGMSMGGMADEKAADKPARQMAAKKEAAGKDSEAPGQPPVHARTDFSETAFFEPQLAITGGKGVFRFTAPEQLTSWKIQAYALTRDVKRGDVAAEAVTRKDLMVQVEMPRFFREDDEGTIKTVVHNETSQPLSGELTLAVHEEGKDDDAATRLGLTAPTQSFSAAPHGLSPLSWKIKAPRGATSFKIRAIVRAGALADAEERDLPILPSRERLIETSLLALDGTMKKVLKLPVFDEKDPTRENESMTLQIDPQLALSILNSLPFLVHYPYECTEQLLDRYVPLAIVNGFYKKNPALAAAAKKIPKRDTITPAWDRNDPRRMTQLMETPWEELSKGRKSYWPVIDMFDDAVVKGELDDSRAKLKSYQNGDGGFPWFPGGRSDPYMTLLVLAGFAEAQRYAVEVPMDVVGRALGYVNNEIPKHMKPDEGSVSLILYAAYVTTSYPRTVPGAQIGWRFAKVWADYADTHADAMTPFGKAYAAYVYWRLGEQAKGDLYLARALDGARQDPIAGVYWAPEKISWLWYNDTVEKHAFFLRTLLTMKPKDPRIPGMVQWLLFNRKGNEWGSTKASAAAIYSLLDVLRSRGALDHGDKFSVDWGAAKETAEVSPYDWLEKPLRWSRYNDEIGPKQGTATIRKEGPGLAFASLTWIYTTDQPAKASGPGMIELSRTFFLRTKKGDEYHLAPLAAGDTVHVGDQLEVQLKINTRSQFEYVHLKDPKAAGFEAEELLSGWKWDQLSRYEEPRDSLTNFFIDWLPHGEYVLRYRLRPTSAGRYRLGAAVLQSMYAPDMSAHSDGFWLKVEE
jgi:uncharacterized protein YfaS (alpha-2-macroglobulin family)